MWRWGSTLTERAGDVMSLQIDETYAGDLKPKHRGAAEMSSRLKALERALRTEGQEGFMNEQTLQRPGCPLVLGSKRERRWTIAKVRASAIVEDLSLWADLCVAQIMVWREIRRQRKLCNRR